MPLPTEGRDPAAVALGWLRAPASRSCGSMGGRCLAILQLWPESGHQPEVRSCDRSLLPGPIGFVGGARASPEPPQTMLPPIACRLLCFLLAATSALTAQTNIEHDNGPDYGTPVPVPAQITGVLTNSVDTDWYRFASAGSAFEFPLTPGAWVLYDANGQYLQRAGASATGSVFVPAGDHFLEVSNPTANNSTYTLGLQPLPTTFTPLVQGPNSGVQSTVTSGTQSFYTFSLPADGRVQLTATGTGVVCELLRSDGRLIRLRANLDVDLPAADYLLRVRGVAGTPTTIQFASTPVALVDLAPGGRHAIPVTTPQAHRLFLLNLVSACTARIETYTAPGSAGVANDTYVVLYDRNFRVLTLGDDSPTYLTPGRLEVPLPAGTYYVGAQYFYDQVGTFDIEADCSMAFPSVAVATSGPNSVTCPGSGGIGMLALDACTPQSVTILATSTLAATERWYWTLMDENGLCTGIGGYDTIKQSPVPQWGNAVRSTRVSAGRNYLLVSRPQWAPFSATVQIQTPLQCEGGMLVGRGRPGDLSVLVGSYVSASPQPLSIFGMGGHTCLDLAWLFVYGFQIYPANGRVTWLPCPATPFGLHLQPVDLFAAPTGPLFGVARDQIPF